MSISLDSITFPDIPNLDAPKHNSDGSSKLIETDTYGSVVPLALVVVLIIILAYFVLFSSIGSNNIPTNEDNSSNKTIGLLVMGLVILLLLLNGAAYIFSVDIVASIKNIFSPQTNIDIEVKNNDLIPSSSGDSIIKKKEVFHVSDNKYNYENAKAICAAYDGRLASYNEISDAYEDGADWCGYGWSKDQMALFPTQEEKWKKLKKIEGHENDCGRPGINGGFIDNPNVRFGVNCYGFKPDITKEEADNMRNQELYPKTKKEIAFDRKVDYWREKLPDIMVSPFNSDNWSVV